MAVTAQVAHKVPAPVTRKVSQMLLIDGQYYWAHPEVAATLAAFFEPDGERLTPGYTEDDFQAYLDQNMGTPRLQYYGHYGNR
jgi:hypothetical protein